MKYFSFIVMAFLFISAPLTASAQDYPFLNISIKKPKNIPSTEQLNKMREGTKAKHLATCANMDLTSPESLQLLNLTNNLKKEKDLLILVDKKHNVGPDYKPAQLMDLYGHKFTPATVKALKEMMAAATRDGVDIYPVSGYRTYDYQKNLFNRRAKEAGLEHANKYIARAGASQHNLGTAVDFNVTETYFEDTNEFAWLMQNAGKYGFSLSFPKGAEELTGYSYEPWHFRYIGKEAVKLQDKFFGGSQQLALEYLKKCAFS